MTWGARTTLAGVGLALTAALVACADEPAPEPTLKSVVQACADLRVAVEAYYDTASPGSTVVELDTWNLPMVHELTIPKPSCSFQIRPDPQLVAGDVFTIENFYLDYDETMTLTLSERLTDAGFTLTDAKFRTWATTYLGVYYSAAVLLFLPEDDSPYADAADHFRLLDLSIGQN